MTGSEPGDLLIKGGRAYAEKWRTGNVRPLFGPPPDSVFVSIAQVVDPDSVVGAFWFEQPSQERGYHAGRVVLTTRGMVYDVEWAGVPPYRSSGQTRMGQIKVAAHTLSQAFEVAWANHDVIRPPGSVDADEILISAEDGWSAKLPPASIYSGGERYFMEVLEAFGLLEPTSTAAV